MNPICPYCDNESELVDSEVVYGKSYGMMFLCSPCDAYVGCHKDSPNNRPLGTLANRSLRSLRKRLMLLLILYGGPAIPGKERENKHTLGFQNL